MSDTDKATGEAPSPNAKPLPVHMSVGSGLLMGGADAIPGVSGGTIALIIGVYERFIGSLGVIVKSPLLFRTPEGRDEIKRALTFLVPLGVGILIAYYLATKLLVGKSEEPGIMRRLETAPACYAFFFGLVLASIPQPFRRIKKVTPNAIIAVCLGAAAAVIFVGLPYTSSEPATWMMIFGGAGAISVMLLPGVSGSLFLVIIGQYATVAGAVHDKNFVVLGVFVVGMALGVGLFVPALRYLLDHKHDVTMAALTGLMAGSLRALWPWKSSYDPKEAPMDNVAIFSEGLEILWVVGGFALGIAVVFLLTRLERRLTELGA